MPRDHKPWGIDKDVGSFISNSIVKKIIMHYQMSDQIPNVKRYYHPNEIKQFGMPPNDIEPYYH
jgi:hypothetical protein